MAAYRRALTRTGSGHARGIVHANLGESLRILGDVAARAHHVTTRTGDEAGFSLYTAMSVVVANDIIFVGRASVRRELLLPGWRRDPSARRSCWWGRSENS